jgi:hypothetical protein
MATVKWDQVGSRVFENGLDRGVLYLPSGDCVPWNGLTNIIEKFNRETKPVYFDGSKINELITLGDFSATLKAVTYPDEFMDFEGVENVRQGIQVGDQRPKTFALSYRTKIGDDIDGTDAGYKIHVLYNVTATPSDKTYSTFKIDPSLIEFEWTISAVPEEVPGFNATAHLVIDSRTTDPFLMEDIEAKLYGSTYVDAALLPMADFVNFMSEWYRVKIVDNGDGTWTATADRPGFIFDVGLEEFLITNCNAIYLDEYTYIISDTKDISEVPQIQIQEFIDGTWTASTPNDNVIVDLGGGVVEIRNATIVFVSPTMYEISDTFDN